MELETDFPDAFRHFLSEAGIQFEDEEDVSFDKTFDHAIEPSINDSDASDQQGAGVNGCFDSFDIEGITTLWSIERTDSVGGSELGMCGQSMGPSSEAREAPHQAGDIVGVTQHFGLFLDSVVDPIDVNSQKDALEGSEWLQMYEDNTSAGEAHQENSISEPVFAASPVVEALSGPDLLEAELGGEDWNKHMAAGGPPAGTSWETPPSLEAAGPSSGATAGCLTGGSRSSASVASQSHIDKPKPAKDSTSTKRRRREAWQLHKSKQAKTTRRNGLGTGRGRYEESVAGADHHGAQQGPMGAKQGPMGTKPGPEECERSPTRCTSPQSEVSSQDVAARTGQHGEDAPDPDGDEGSSDRDLDEVTRKQKRLIRNRESACQSRLRRKSYMADMEGKCAFLESQVKHLQQAASLQIMENAHLRQELARVQHLFGHAVAPAPPPPGGAPVPPGAPAGGNAEPKTRTKTKTHARTSGQKKGGKSGSVAEPAVLESDSLPSESLPLLHTCPFLTAFMGLLLLLCLVPSPLCGPSLASLCLPLVLLLQPLSPEARKEEHLEERPRRFLWRIDRRIERRIEDLHKGGALLSKSRGCIATWRGPGRPLDDEEATLGTWKAVHDRLSVGLAPATAALDATVAFKAGKVASPMVVNASLVDRLGMFDSEVDVGAGLPGVACAA